MAHPYGPGPRRALLLVGLVPTYVLLALIGQELGVFGLLSVWYLPAGLAMAAALLLGPIVFVPVAVAELIGGLFVFQGDFTPLQMVLNAAGYAGAYVGTAMMMRRTSLSSRFGTLRYGSVVLFVGVLLAPLLAALYGVGMQYWAGVAGPGGPVRKVAIWFLGDAVGVATLAPAILSFVDLRRRGATASLMQVGAPYVAAAVILPAAIAVAVFAWRPDNAGFLYVFFVPVALVALRFGVIGVALSALTLSPTVTLLANREFGNVVMQRSDVQLLLLGVLLMGYLIGLTADDGDRALAHSKRLVDELAQRERRLHEAERLAGMGSFEWDAETNHVVWSDGLYALYSASPDQAPASVEGYLERVVPEDRAQVTDTVRRAIDEGTDFEHDYRILRDDGAVRTVHARGEVVLADDGSTAGLVGYCQDVTAARRLEQVLRETVEREQQAATVERAAVERAREIDRMKDALLMAISHEVRTPLTLIRGIVETLDHDRVAAPGAVRRTLIDRLAANVERLSALLEDLLDVDRLSRGIVQPRRTMTEVADLVEEVIHNVPSDGRIKVDPIDDLRANVDRGLVARILENIIANALRYTEAPAPVRVRVMAKDEDLHLVVEDEGDGVPVDLREAIFEPFAQGRIIEHAPGTGVGLYLVARFAELHGGRAWVTDREGGGAAFHVVLPDVCVTSR